VSRPLAFVRGVEGELSLRLLPGQVAAVLVPDVPWDYTDEEAVEIVRAVDEAITLEGVHTWRDVVGTGEVAGVLAEEVVEVG